MSHALKEDDECVDRVPDGSPGLSRVGKDQGEDQDEADRPPEPPHAVQRARSCRSAAPPVAVNVSGSPAPELSGVAKQHATADPKADHGYRQPGGEPCDAREPGGLHQAADVARPVRTDQYAPQATDEQQPHEADRQRCLDTRPARDERPEDASQEQASD